MASARVELSRLRGAGAGDPGRDAGARLALRAPRGGAARVIQTFYFEPLQLAGRRERGERRLLQRRHAHLQPERRSSRPSSLAGDAGADAALLPLPHQPAARGRRRDARHHHEQRPVAAGRDPLPGRDGRARPHLQPHDRRAGKGLLRRSRATPCAASVAERRERKLRNVFQMYVPRDVIDQHISNPEALLRATTPSSPSCFPTCEASPRSPRAAARRPGRDAQPLLHRLGRRRDGPRGDRRQVHGRRDHGLLRRSGKALRRPAARALRSAFDMLRASLGVQRVAEAARAARVPRGQSASTTG